MKDVLINISGYEVIISTCDAERLLIHKWHTEREFKTILNNAGKVMGLGRGRVNGNTREA
jgi:hypothetical protein